MAYASGRYGRAPYAGTNPIAPPPPGQQTLPPPIPGGTNTWIYQPNRGWGFLRFAYAGRRSTLTYPGGGISILPIAERGVMRVSAWWPDARQLVLTRIHSDGTQHPVRGGTLAVTTETRRNYALNPSFEVGLNGYTPDAGSPTLARVVDGTAPRGLAHLTATVAGAGSCGITVPQALPAGRDSRVALDLKFSARPTGVTIQIGWADYQGVALTTATVALTADQINNSVTQWARQSVLVTNPPAGITATVKVIAAGMPAAGVMSVDGILLGSASDSGDFFDGSIPGAQWLGVTGLSASLLPPVLNFDDGECPLDEPVSYRLTNPAPTGGSMTSAVSELPSNEVVWLTHPRDSTHPREVLIDTTRPTTTIAARQGRFQAIGDNLMTVVSGARRTAPSGEISLWTTSARDRAELGDLLADMAPVLLRTPASLDFADVSWISLGDIVQELDGAGPRQGLLKWTSPFVSTRPPIG